MKKGLILLILVVLVAAHALTADAGIIEDARALFTTSQSEDNPYIPVGQRFFEQAKQEEAAGNSIEALEFYRLAATVDRRNREAVNSAIRIKKMLDASSEEHLRAARSLLDTDREAAKLELLKALRFNTDNERAHALLQKEFSRPVLSEYTVKEGDTLLRIAEAQYNNPGGELLLTRINNLSIVDVFEPGSTIDVPIVSARLSKRLYPVAKPEGELGEALKKQAEQEAAQAAAVAQEVFEEPLQESMVASAPSSAEALLSTAQLQFSNGLYDTAVSITEEILAADPANEEAKQIRNDSYLALAKAKWADGSAANTMRMLIRLPEGYKDSGSLRAKAKSKLDADSEPLYLAGVKYFLGEELQKAVEQWELTLQVNPFHAKARSDLERARKLLDAVRGL